MAKVPFRQRYRDSRAIFRQTLQMMGGHRDLWVFPGLSFAALLPLLLAIGLGGFLVGDPVFAWMGRMADGPLGPFVGLLAIPFVFVLGFPFFVLAGLLNAAMVFAAHERMEGRPGLKREAWKRALRQLGPLVRFNAIAMLVAGVLAAVGQLLEKLRLVPFLGQVTQAVGTFAWAAAAFFVIPILVVDGERSAVQALRSSVTMARSQWGKSVAGIVTIGLVFMVPLFVALAVLMPAFVLAMTFQFVDPRIAAGVLIGAMLVLVIGIGILSAAAQTLYQTALYRFARSGVVTLPYTPETLVDVWRPYH